MLYSTTYCIMRLCQTQRNTLYCSNWLECLLELHTTHQNSSQLIGLLKMTPLTWSVFSLPDQKGVPLWWGWPAHACSSPVRERAGVGGSVPCTPGAGLPLPSIPSKLHPPDQAAGQCGRWCAGQTSKTWQRLQEEARAWTKNAGSCRCVANNQTCKLPKQQKQTNKQYTVSNLSLVHFFLIHDKNPTL